MKYNLLGDRYQYRNIPWCFGLISQVYDAYGFSAQF